jgi:hypothetical protein
MMFTLPGHQKISALALGLFMLAIGLLVSTGAEPHYFGLAAMALRYVSNTL